MKRKFFKSFQRVWMFTIFLRATWCRNKKKKRSELGMVKATRFETRPSIIDCRTLSFTRIFDNFPIYYYYVFSYACFFQAILLHERCSLLIRAGANWRLLFWASAIPSTASISPLHWSFHAARERVGRTFLVALALPPPLHRSPHYVETSSPEWGDEKSRGKSSRAASQPTLALDNSDCVNVHVLVWIRSSREASRQLKGLLDQLERSFSLLLDE